MLFPLHELPDAPAKVQIGFFTLILGIAWLASGQLVRAWAKRRGQAAGLRAFAANRDWRWVGAILVVGGLCVARPWGMESGPFIWLRHTALLLIVLLAGEVLSARQKSDSWLAPCLLVSLILYCVLALRLVVRYSVPELSGAGFLSTPWLHNGLFALLVGSGVLALAIGCWRVLKHLREVAPLQALALVLMLPMFAEGTMLAGAIDCYSREASHQAAIDTIFSEEPIPAGIHELVPACLGENAVYLGEWELPDAGEDGADHSGCHSCPTQ